MFARIKRLIKSFMNKFIGSMEDPVLILENNIREMKEKLPKLNEGVAKAHGTVILLDKQLKAYKEDEKKLRAKLKAAAIAGEDKIGKEIALQLQRVINQVNETKASLKTANDGLKSMEELRDTQVRRIKAEIAKIKDAIEDSKVAKLKGELAELFETYKVEDVAFSNEEMMEKLEEETAMNEGKLSAAATSVDMKEIELEKKAEEIEANQLYEQFKAEMDIDIAPSKEEKTEKEKTVEKTIN